MLIVCTKDPVVVRAAQDPQSGAGRWGALVIIDPRYNQAQATAAFERSLRGLDEPLCISAHGNDEEIGDEGTGAGDWGWSRRQVALMLQDRLPARYAGPILIHACAESVSNFSAGLAYELGRVQALNGVWVYGYNRALPSDAGFPDPGNLDRNRELQGTQVRYQLDGEAAPVTVQRPVAYRATLASGVTLEIPLGADPAETRRLLDLMSAGSQG